MLKDPDSSSRISAQSLEASFTESGLPDARFTTDVKPDRMKPGLGLNVFLSWMTTKTVPMQWPC